jgi:HPt (histidine-containing phosphotransfer) domain-containing protein
LADGPKMDQTMAGLWADAKPRLQGRVEVLRSAADEALVGRLDDERRREAEGEAHKLSGSLGMFGLAEGSRLANLIELALEGTDALSATELAEQVRALSDAVEGHE